MENISPSPFIVVLSLWLPRPLPSSSTFKPVQVSDLLDGNSASSRLSSSAMWSHPAKLPDDIVVAGWFCDFVASQPVNRDSSRSNV